jgi:hypothetical protein
MKYSSFIIIIILLSNSSCKKDFLNNVDDGSLLTRQEYVINLQTTGEFLQGIYPMLSTSLYAGHEVIYPDLIADNIKPVVASAGVTPLLPHYSWTQQADETAGTILASSTNCNSSSYGAYKIIRACNFVLEKATEYGSQDATKADQIKGQAYALRSLVDFLLVNIFSQPYNFTADASHKGIALAYTSSITEPVTGRNTVSEVYNQIISDLNNAIRLLPVNTSSPLLMNRNAAKALLARVYLYKGDYTSAKNLAAEVSKNVPIMVTNYPSKLFTPEETEALFQLPPGDFTTNMYSTTFAGYYFRSQIQFRATSDIAILLTENPNDLRKNWVTSISGNWNIIKYPTGTVTGPISDKANAYHQTILRSSEMYLTAAECYAKLNNSDSALYYLNAIQKRANTLLTDASITGPALLDSIYKERRKELAFEGLRMFDLLRWKRSVNRTDALDGTLKALPYPNTKAIAPIPGLDVKVFSLQQNDEY